MPKFFLAYHIHTIPREPAQESPRSNPQLELVQKAIDRFTRINGGVLLHASSEKGTYSFEDVKLAVQAAIEMQIEIDALNAGDNLTPIMLLSMGIVSLVNPFTNLEESGRSLELANFLSDSASAGELYLSEGAYNCLGGQQFLTCRFDRQLIRAGESKALNAYKVFWVPMEVELGILHKDPDEIDLDIQPIRSFGLKLFLFILFLFFSVLMMTIGIEPLWIFLMQIIYK
jgi:hypothetical protein